MALNPVTDAFAASLRARLPAAAFRATEARYLDDPRGLSRGRAGLVVAPGATEEVAAVIAAAAEARVPVIPYGGGTGLVGGQLAAEGPAPLILSLERMTRIRAVHPEENVLIAEAGAILADIQAAAAAADRLFALSIAAEGSARIGGNLATNAGGLNVLRYGNARDLCLGVEAVLPDGQVLHGLKRLRKDNTGYDLRHLLIGAEGTLGVITAASLRLFPRPVSEAAALMVVPDPAAALKLLAVAGREVGGDLSAFELISGQGPAFLAETMPELRQPFATPPEWMVLVEAGLAAGGDAGAVLESLFAAGAEAELVSDGLVSRSEAQRAGFWALREAIPEANRRIGAVASHDVSLPLGAIAEFLERAGAIVAGFGALRVNCFGHLGDGNLHYNVFPPRGEDRARHLHRRGEISRAIHDLVAELAGSFSAEHGIGRLKAGDLARYADPAGLAVMRRIKAALDPRGIMNPGAILVADADADAGGGRGRDR